MGAIAAEFQWELSFLEQKQQACLFLFFVGASRIGTCGSAQSSSPSMPFVQGFQIELYWIVLCECPLRSMETQMGVLIWENPVFILQDASLARGHNWFSYPRLLSRVCTLYPVLGRKLWRSLRHIEFLKYIDGSNFLELPESERFSFVLRYNRLIGIIFEISSMIL